MGDLPVTLPRSPALPQAGDVYVLVHTEDGAFRVHYDGGSPFWVRREYENGAIAVGFPASLTTSREFAASLADHAAAITAAEAFLAGFRAPSRDPSIAEIVRVVAEDYGLPPKLLCGDWRRGDMVEARWVAMWIAREGFGRHLSMIGACMGRRDHTTVAHGVATVTARRERDPEFRARTDRLREQATRIINGEH